MAYEDAKAPHTHVDRHDDTLGKSLEAIKSVCFRLSAEFVVATDTVTTYLLNPELTPEERRLMLTIMTTPEALNRVRRLALIEDLESQPGFFEDRFLGPDIEDILQPVLPYLCEEDRTYWRRMFVERRESAGDSITAIFCEFKTSLHYVAVEDVSSGDAVPIVIRRNRKP